MNRFAMEVDVCSLHKINYTDTISPWRCVYAVNTEELWWVYAVYTE